MISHLTLLWSVYDFKLLKFIEIGYTAQHMFYIGIYFTCIWKELVPSKSSSRGSAIQSCVTAFHLHV